MISVFECARRRVFLMCSLGAFALVIACGPPNPLLGSWKLDEERSAGLAGIGAVIGTGLSGVREIEFRPDKIVTGDRSESVSYEVAGDRVIVTGPDGQGVVYTVVDENHITLEKSTGRVSYVRVAPRVAQPPR